MLPDAKQGDPGTTAVKFSFVSKGTVAARPLAPRIQPRQSLTHTHMCTCVRIFPRNRQTGLRRSLWWSRQQPPWGSSCNTSALPCPRWRAPRPSRYASLRENQHCRCVVDGREWLTTYVRVLLHLHPFCVPFGLSHQLKLYNVRLTDRLDETLQAAGIKNAVVTVEVT